MTMPVPVEAIVSQWATTATVRATGPREMLVQLPDARPVPVVVFDSGPGEVEIRARWTAPPEIAANSAGLAAMASAAAMTRSGLLRCQVASASIDIAVPVYLDGLTRNFFLAAAAEVAKAGAALDISARQSGAPESGVTAQSDPGPLDTLQVSEPIPDVAPMHESAAMQEPVSAYEPAPVQLPPEPVHAATAEQPQWTPTHTVPTGGVPSWATPDGSVPSVGQLPPGLQVRLVERRGDWARVETENGWSSWVDGRPLN